MKTCAITRDRDTRHGPQPECDDESQFLPATDWPGVDTSDLDAQADKNELEWAIANGFDPWRGVTISEWLAGRE